jgi:hypothetical protein
MGKQRIQVIYNKERLDSLKKRGKGRELVAERYPIKRTVYHISIKRCH